MQDYTREKELFLSKFSDRDDRINHFEKMFSTWTKSLSDDVKPIVFELLSNFDYYTHSNVMYIPLGQNTVHGQIEQPCR